MKKKVLSLALCLAMLAVLTAPAQPVQRRGTRSSLKPSKHSQIAAQAPTPIQIRTL